MVLSDKTEIKTFILFLLQNINDPLDFNTLHDVVVQDGFVKYIDFLDCFAELLEAGQVDEVITDIPLYSISDNGKIAVAELSPKLFGTIKEKALRSAMRLLAFYREGSKINSNIENEGEGWRFHCTMTDGKRELLEMNVFYTDYDYAQRIKANFDENAEKIYKGTMAILSGDVNYIFDK